MTTDRKAEYLVSLLRELCKLPRETEWVEFKHNNADPQEIGEYLSALANAAALNGKAFAYLVWGVDDKTHNVVGTDFSPAGTRKGNEPLETWLLRLLTPKIHFHFHELTLDGLPVVVLEIGRAFRHPLRFQADEFIRIGAVKKPLKEAPDRERALWRIFDQIPFESMIAVDQSTADDVLRLLDYPAYFDLTEQPLPADREGIIAALADDGLIQRCEAGGWDITNLGRSCLRSGWRISPLCAARPCGSSTTVAGDEPRPCGNSNSTEAMPAASPVCSTPSAAGCPPTRSSGRRYGRASRCFQNLPCVNWSRMP